SSGPFTTIPNIQDVTPPTLEGSRPNKTAHDSPGARHEKTPGLVEPGEIVFRLLFSAAQMTALKLLVRAIKFWKVTWPIETGETTASSWVAEGFLYSIQSITPLDEPMQLECKVQLSGVETFTAGTLLVALDAPSTEAAGIGSADRAKVRQPAPAT